MTEVRIPLQGIADGSMLPTGSMHRFVVEVRRIEIYLHDIYGKPLPGAAFDLKCGDQSFQGKADDQAKAEVSIGKLAERCTVRWSSATNSTASGFEYTREIFLRLHAKDAPEGHKRRLHNLGLPGLDDVELALGLFQTGWDLEPTQQSDDDTVDKLAKAALEPIAHDDQSEGSDGDDSGDRT